MQIAFVIPARDISRAPSGVGFEIAGAYGLRGAQGMARGPIEVDLLIGVEVFMGEDPASLVLRVQAMTDGRITWEDGQVRPSDADSGFALAVAHVRIETVPKAHSILLFITPASNHPIRPFQSSVDLYGGKGVESQ